MTVTERLNELRIDLPPVATPAGAYVPAVRVGDLVHTAGQLPFVDGALARTGKVGAGVTPDDAATLARVAALNALAAAGAAAGGVDNLVRVVKVVVFVASASDFTAQPQVANGASDVLGQVFGTPHARSAVGVAVLPMDSPVEVEMVVEVASAAS
ncbi:RidA family protein [Propionicicella superfundia]|uniref:RidA family protein n=1 Tax=Propionicicella superfundia TaxID=348582 RepID=UPI00040F1B9B|nr:RidA family protein [Propionicicella superfundia]